MTIDVLNLEWNSSPSRDREVATLVCNYLKYAGFVVVEGQMHDGFRLLEKYKPKVLFLSNLIGAKINVEVAQYARSKNIPIVTGIVEGNFLEDDIEAGVWGCNEDNTLYESIICYWSDDTKELAVQKFPHLNKIIKVSGYVGFDRYKFIKDVKIKKSKIIKGYEKVVGIGCWDFGVVKYPDSRYKLNLKRLTRDEMSFFLKDRDDFNKELLHLISEHKHIMFLIKEHPGRQLGHWASGIEECDQFNNVTIIHNELGIEECIRRSDLWITYDSTTSMEAWLLGKETAVLNPNGIDFPMRCGTHTGQPVFSSAFDLGCAINEYYTNGTIIGFNELVDVRNSILQRVTKWYDGYNHVRFGNEIINILKNIPDKEMIEVECNIPSNKYRIYQKFLWYMFRFIKKIHPSCKFEKISSNIRYQWDNGDTKYLSNKRMNQQIALYKRDNFTVDNLSNINCEQLHQK